MNRLFAFLLVALLAWTITAVPVQRKTANEQTKTLQPSKDATLIESSKGLGGSSKGASIFVGRTGQPEDPSEPIQKRRGLMAFDLSAIPRRSRILSVTLTMTVIQSAGQKPSTINLYRVTRSWKEGTSVGDSGRGAQAEAGDPTWIHSSYPNQLWSRPGGDYVKVSSAKTDVNGKGSYTWASTPALVADVQSWVNSPKSNFGWILIGDESQSQTAKRFHSSEATTATDRPQLTVVFRPPSR